jgi:hypothetical protein
VDDICRHLEDADRFQSFVQRLDNQQLHPFRAAVFDRADSSAAHSSE